MQELLNIMKIERLDYSRTFRSLSNIIKENNYIGEEEDANSLNIDSK